MLSHVWLFVTLWSLPGSSVYGIFSRQEYWSGFSFPSPRHLPNQGTGSNQHFRHWQVILYCWAAREAQVTHRLLLKKTHSIVSGIFSSKWTEALVCSNILLVELGFRLDAKTFVPLYVKLTQYLFQKFYWNKKATSAKKKLWFLMCILVKLVRNFDMNFLLVIQFSNTVIIQNFGIRAEQSLQKSIW